MSKVLVADDASFMRLMIRQILARRGYVDVVEAENGLRAVELYKATRPELVLLDITMPELDGLAALAEILEFDSRAKILICSAVAQQKMVAEALKRGALDFIIKPFRPDELLAVVSKYLD